MKNDKSGNTRHIDNNLYIISKANLNVLNIKKVLIRTQNKENYS